MGKIVGLAGTWDEGQRWRLVERMLEVAQGATLPQTRRLDGLGACLGACDRGEPATYAAGDLLVVVDGHFYAPPEGDGKANAAELLAGLYRQYGFAKALELVNGDFALALYDVRVQELWIGRDRFGVKPLYYARTSEGFAFASRPRALFALPGMSQELNRQYVALFAASHYRYFDNAPAKSPYNAIYQLPPAHWARVRRDGITTGRYWRLGEEADFTEPEEELAERYRALLLDAVAIRLRHTRRPAFTLSGGMDSSSVLASAVHLTGVKQQAFSAVYPDRTYDESVEIRSTREGLVEDWHAVRVDPSDVFSLVRRMLDAHDEPVATATWLSHFLVCEQAAQCGFESLFGGMGGDELNAGEYEHFFYFFADLRATGREQRLKREVEMWACYHDHPIFRKNWTTMEEGLARLADPSQPGRCLPDRARLERYAAALNPEYYDLRTFDPVMEHPFHSYLKNRTYQDLTRETIPCCLRAEERQTSAFGLDHFLPLLDHRLAEFMFRVPGTVKYREGVTKHLLREAMRGILPEETRLRVKKTGWNAPAHLWFAGQGREVLLDLVGSQRFRERGIYNVPEILRLIDEHEAIVHAGGVRENHMMLLWQLINLDLWLRDAGG